MGANFGGELLVKELISHLNPSWILRVQLPNRICDFRYHSTELVVFLVVIPVLDVVSSHDLWQAVHIKQLHNILSSVFHRETDLLTLC